MSSLEDKSWQRNLNDDGEDRVRVLFITWSNPKKAGHAAPSEKTREEFANMIRTSLRSIQKSVSYVASLCVFQEMHKDKTIHYHSVVAFESRTRCAPQLREQLYELYKVSAHITTAHGSRPLERCLEYLMVPTVSKMQLDPTPYFSQEDMVPPSVADKVAKAYVKLERGTPGNHEVYEYLSENESIKTYSDFLKMVDKPGDKSIREKRLSRYISHNISSVEATVGMLIDRRDAPYREKEAARTAKDYLCQKFSEHCSCTCTDPQSSLEKDIDYLLFFHGEGNVQPFFTWADQFLTDSLVSVGRPKNSFTHGCPGSGKSTLADLIRMIIPESRIHTPCLNTSTPFSSLRSDHLLSICEDWRFTSRVPVNIGILFALPNAPACWLGSSGRINRPTRSDPTR